MTSEQRVEISISFGAQLVAAALETGHVPTICVTHDPDKWPRIWGVFARDGLDTRLLSRILREAADQLDAQTRGGS